MMFVNAIENYKQALEIFRAIGDRREQVNILSLMGNVYLLMKQIKSDIEYEEQSRIIYHEIGDRSSEAKQLDNMGATFIAIG
jgi:tetratricopeptide (TPR) repeat protein